MSTATLEGNPDLFESLVSADERSRLYEFNKGIQEFTNPLFGVPRAIVMKKKSSEGGGDIKLKDFLVSISSFSNFSDQQLLTLEQKATIKRFNPEDIIFKQGEEGESFYVIHEGIVDILIQDKQALLESDNFGKVVNRLTGGCYFGERALMTSEKRAATIKVMAKTVCLVFTKAVYEEVISGSNALIGKDVSDHVDWSKDHETRSLYKHVESILEIDDPSNGYSKAIRELRYNITTIFTPELLADEIMSRMVLTVQKAVNADRVGMFVLNEDRRSMVLKVSERSKGVRLPVRGLAGAIVETNDFLNIPDAYQDPRFDSTMDRRTGYTTKQVLGVPVRNPLNGDAVGVLQVNNRTDMPDSPFTDEQRTILELAASQVSELLHSRAELFTASGGGAKSRATGAGEGVTVKESYSVNSMFQVDIFALSLGQWGEKIKKEHKLDRIKVEVSLFLALQQLCTPQDLDVSLGKNVNDLEISENVTFNIAVRDLPRAARILFRVTGQKGTGKPVELGWAAQPIFDFSGNLDTLVDVRLFPGTVEAPMATTLSNNNDNDAPALSVILGPDLVLGEESSTPRVRVIHTMPISSEPILGEDNTLSSEQKTEIDRLQRLSFNPLGSQLITDEEREVLWDLRHMLINRADILPAFIMSMHWKDSDRVRELYALLDLWKLPEPSQALLLLDRRFMDPKVRAYAIHCLENLDDTELSLYMLQLCQQLKFENHIDSALSRFLLRRALRSKKLIGHIFYWQLQSEIHNIDVKRRFVVLLQIYIRNCGTHRIELGRQVFVMKRLESVAEEVCKGASKKERLEILRKELTECVLPNEFQLPLSPHLSVKGIDVSKCRVMESKKKPLWLTLYNADETKDDIVLMLKVGDDLRQDALVIQLLRVMNLLWAKEGLDMQMMLYDCISTGDERGLLQVVLNSTTIGSVLLDSTDKYKKANNQSVKAGSMLRKIRSAFKALRDFSVLQVWIKEQIQKEFPDIGEGDEKWEEELDKRTQSFIISTAAYCVASYVLGLGDRHNDNLMITKKAHFFHIDFGHMLGNFKSKYGIKRERAPFVFTYAMKQCMNDEQYDDFKDLCCDIYNILRQNASMLVSLISLAIPCNLPELQSEKDVVWIYEKLMVHVSEEEASQHFRDTLDDALGTTFTRLNDATHMLAHA